MKPKNKIVINSKSYRVLIITCWAVYIACFIIKLCGANIFEIACSNQNFINICNYVDNTQWLKMTLACINFMIGASFILLAELKQTFFNWKQALLVYPMIIASSIISWYYPIVSSVMSIIVYLLPIFFNYKKWYRAIIGLILLTIFQLLSLVTKNVNTIFLNNQSTLISLILQIDVLIMCVLYYLYANSLTIIKEGGK